MHVSTLDLDAPANFRDLSELVSSRLPLRTRRLFRSDHLGALDTRQARRVQALGVRRVLDFRGVHERRSAVCAVPGVTVHSLAIEPTIVQVINELTAAGQRLSAADVVAHMEDTYRAFVSQHTPRFAEFFGYLLASDEPTVFHCTAGKDRTGFAAALALFALGATREEVMRDYLLTNQRLKPPAGAWRELAPEAVAVLWGVQPEFLLAAFEAVDREHGSLEAYLRDGLGLRDAERAQLRTLYLRPA
jgi:protein-tyrosine phosphatase